MDETERRIKTRYPSKIEVNYVHKDDYLISFTKNLSVDGMFIYTENPPEINDIIQIKFSVENEPEINVSAKVAWINKKGDKRDFGIGVKFVDPPSFLKGHILKIVNKIAILNNKKNSF